jgi:hypothetical protein
MAELAVNTNALNFVRAINRLPISAAKITFFEPDAMDFCPLTELDISIR